MDPQLAAAVRRGLCKADPAVHPVVYRHVPLHHRVAQNYHPAQTVHAHDPNAVFSFRMEQYGK